MSTTIKRLAALALTMLLPLAAAAQVKDHREIKFPKLPEFKIPKPEVYKLGNGMTVFLMEDRELPLINVNAVIRTGSYYESADKAGLAQIFGQVQREGGTTSMPGDRMDDYLEARAAFVETGMSNDSGSASMNCLKQDFDDVFKVFADVLRNPAFADEKIELAKVQTNTGIARRNDDVGQITGREFARLIYGKDSPRGRNVEYATVAAITRDDLVAWHKKFYHPNNILLGVVGDFDSKAMKSKIQQVLGDWKTGPAFAEGEVAYNKQPNPGVYFIPKDDVTQANIRLGHLGITTKNPDYFAVQVMNEVFGGGFSARLFSNVRSKKGLAYSVFGSLGSSFARQGMFLVGLQTKSETMGVAVDALKEEIRGIINNPPDAAELQRAKDSILNSFVFRYASRGQVLAQQMTYAYYDMPSDFLEQYRANIEKVSAADVARVAKKYLKPDQLTLLVVGKESDFDRPVESFGKVSVVDISIPPMADATASVERSEENLERGATLMKKVATTIGGKNPAAVNAIRSDAKMSISMGGQEMALTQSVTGIYPDRAHVVVQTPMGEQKVVLDGGTGFMMMGGQVRDLPPDQIARQMENFARDLNYLSRYHDSPKLVAIAAGSDEVDGKACDLVRVEFDGVASQLCVASDGLVLRQVYQGMNPITGAPGTVENFFSDYREVDGLMVPYKQVMMMGGQTVLTTTVETFEVNPEVDEAMFVKPAA